MSLVLYASDMTPTSRAVTMLIENLNLDDVKYEEVCLLSRDHYRADFIAKNPLHTVPVLEDEDLVIVDSHSILTYLASKYSAGDLYPKDLKARCMVDQRLYFDATILFPSLKNVIFSLLGRKSKGVTQEQRKDIEEAYGFMEIYLQRSRYIALDHLTVADLACVATLSSMQFVVPVADKYVRIHRWWDKLKGERWYLTKNIPGAMLFRIYINGLLRKR